MSKKVIVIGAGAAGLLAAGFAGRAGADVLVLEKNSQPGKKLNITGKGRCNVTNNCDFRKLLENIPQNPRFMYRAFSAFSPQDMMELLEENGVRLKT
ncbi:MAG: NAD(P)/FAD-dependent oxidoreductase, partial [Oscillospiraceae bacterium]|nr:NAD(P)/FAD-dependent oxidoreductase [Oscillospiraceae bacterium]